MLSQFKRKIFLFLPLLLGFALVFSACEDDDDDDMMTASPMGSFTASDQVVTGDALTVASVTLDRDGWVVVHRSTGGGPVVPDIISVPKLLPAGTSTDVLIEFRDGVELMDGEELFVMLHTDDGMPGEYEFDGSNGLDAPLTDADGNVVTSPVTIRLQGFDAKEQTLSQNTVLISEVTVAETGWVVLHKDNGMGGPVVPDIVSVPTQVNAGTTTDVAVTFQDNVTLQDGETIWVMLHTDNGVMGEYEFDGNSGFDGPLTDRMGNVLTSPVTVNAPGITVSDQAVVNGTVTIAAVEAAVDGWIVIHNQTGTGDIELPGIVGKTRVTAGTNTDVVIELDDSVTYEPGQSLYPMLHIDVAPTGEYNFPGDDVPEVYGTADGNIVVTSFEVQ